MEKDLHHGIYLLLGTNEGDRVLNLATAISDVATKVGRIAKQSPIYETAPWGKTDQPPFLNQAVEIETPLSPHELLDTLQNIETLLGRIRLERWGPRVIDIDILLYGVMVVNTDRLVIPHPRLAERKFALLPLASIGGEVIHPLTRHSIHDMLRICPDTSDVTIFNL